MCALKDNVRLRKASRKNLEEILRLMGDYYRGLGLAFRRSDSRKALAALLSNDEYGFIDLILFEDQLVGYICITYGYSLEYSGRDCVLDDIYVAPEYQRRGIGSAVLRLIQGKLSEEGFRAIHLEVFDRNERARDFFVKNGFAVHKSSFMSKVL